LNTSYKKSRLTRRPPAAPLRLHHQRIYQARRIIPFLEGIEDREEKGTAMGGEMGRKRKTMAEKGSHEMSGSRANSFIGSLDEPPLYIRL